MISEIHTSGTNFREELSEIMNKQLEEERQQRETQFREEKGERQKLAVAISDQQNIVSLNQSVLY